MNTSQHTTAHWHGSRQPSRQVLKSTCHKIRQVLSACQCRRFCASSTTITMPGLANHKQNLLKHHTSYNAECAALHSPTMQPPACKLRPPQQPDRTHSTKGTPAYTHHLPRRCRVGMYGITACYCWLPCACQLPGAAAGVHASKPSIGCLQNGHSGSPLALKHSW